MRRIRESGYQGIRITEDSNRERGTHDVTRGHRNAEKGYRKTLSFGFWRKRGHEEQGWKLSLP
jgi:hypothetical protein